MTQRLYYTDAALRVFDARVVAADRVDGRTHLVLDRTAFYPTSGGQPFDTGFIDDAPVVDVPAMAQRLSEPLPAMSVAASVASPSPAPVAPVIEQKPTEMTDEALWEAMKAPEGQPAPLAAPAAPALPSFEPLTTQSGLTKRVRGAQMPELGSAQTEDTPPRPADEVRSTLASLQRGIDLGRQRNSDS